VFESSVDRLGRAFGGAGSVEVGQHVCGALLQGASEGDDLARRGRDAVADRLDQLLHRLLALGPVGFAVGGDHPLVDAPGRLYLDVLIDRELVGQPLLLLVGEQVRSGVQGPPRGVERVALAAPVPVNGLLDPATALIQRIPGEAHHVKRVHHRHGVGQFLGGGGLEAGEPVHRDHLDRLAPGLGAIGQPGLECLLRAAFDHVQQPCRPGCRHGSG